MSGYTRGARGSSEEVGQGRLVGAFGSISEQDIVGKQNRVAGGTASGPTRAAPAFDRGQSEQMVPWLPRHAIYLLGMNDSRLFPLWHEWKRALGSLAMIDQ